MRFLSGFTNKDIIGLGFHGNISFFQIGADFVLSKIFSYKNNIKEHDDWDAYTAKHETTPEWDARSIEQNTAMIKANFYPLEQTEEQIAKNEQDYIRPQFQFAISPGINLKYVSIECGIGMVVSQTVRLKQIYYGNQLYGKGYGKGVDEWPKSQTNLLIRPTLVGYIPIQNGGVSISVGYNIVDKLDIYNGFIASLGFIVKL